MVKLTKLIHFLMVFKGFHPVLDLDPDPDPKPRVTDPEPKISFRSMRIRIHNTVINIQIVNQAAHIELMQQKNGKISGIFTFHENKISYRTTGTV
jgi:hypothetical protein